MPLDAAFFKHGDTSFSIFYPRGYALAVYPDSATAERAGDALRGAGTPAADVMVATGDEVVAHYAAMRDDPTALARVERLLSRLYTDESELAGELLEHARRGRGFVATPAPDAPTTDRVVAALRTHQPILVRRYDEFTITELA